MKVEPPLPSSGSRCRFVPFVWVTDSIDSINPPQLGRNKTGWGEENALRAQLDIFSTKFFFPKIGNVRRIDGNVACKCVGFPCEGMVTSPLPWPPEWIQHVTRPPPSFPAGNESKPSSGVFHFLQQSSCVALFGIWVLLSIWDGRHFAARPGESPQGSRDVTLPFLYSNGFGAPIPFIDARNRKYELQSSWARISSTKFLFQKN